MPPADIVRRINAPGVELLRRAVVEAVDVDHQQGVGVLERRRRRPVQDAVFVDGVEQGPAQHEHRMLVALDLQLVEAAELIAGLVAFYADEPQPRGRPGDGVVPCIGQADHQGGMALVHGHHRMVGKDETGARSREAGEDQPGHHREERHAGEDFDGGDEVAVIGLRVHVAIADRGQRLDRKIEEVEDSLPGDVGDRTVAERIEHGEQGVESDEDQRGGGEKRRPGNGHRPVIKVGPEAWSQTKGLDLAMADPDALEFVRSCLAPRFCQCAISLVRSRAKRQPSPPPRP